MCAAVYFHFGNFSNQKQMLFSNKEGGIVFKNLQQLACTQRKSDVLVGIEQEAYSRGIIQKEK
jgi:hypothetical protein